MLEFFIAQSFGRWVDSAYDAKSDRARDVARDVAKLVMDLDRKTKI